ncbi:hypothetical protein ACOME3_008244 [Neoechinorhynchus agilis]
MYSEIERKSESRDVSSPEQFGGSCVSPPLKEAPVIRAIGGTRIETLGSCVVQVRVDRKLKNLEVIVITGIELPIFGLSWMLAIGLKIPEAQIVQVNQIQENKAKARSIGSRIQEQFPTPFDGHTAAVKGFVASFAGQYS